jgi:hypothetical protein
MRQDSYCRLHEACLAMANQSTEPDVAARWLAMAEAWLQRSLEIGEPRGMVKREPSEPWALTGQLSTDAPDRGKGLSGPAGS